MGYIGALLVLLMVSATMYVLDRMSFGIPPGSIKRPEAGAEAATSNAWDTTFKANGAARASSATGGNGSSNGASNGNNGRHGQKEK